MISSSTFSSSCSSDPQASFQLAYAIDTPTEADYYRHGGVLNFVLRNLAAR